MPLFRPWDKIRRGEREFWTLLMFGLVFLELRTLYLDRAENNAVQAHARCEELQQFTAIASTLEDSIGESRDQFRVTMRAFSDAQTANQKAFQATITEQKNLLAQTRQLSSLAQENLLDVSGGKSYGYVVPQNIIGVHYPAIALANGGDRPLTGVVVRISRVLNECAQHDALGQCLLGTDRGIQQPIQMGTLGADETVEMPGGIEAAPDGQTLSHYVINVGAQNGTSTEDIWFRPAKDGSGYAYKLRVAIRYRGKDGDSKGNAPLPEGFVYMRFVKQIDWVEPVSMADAVKQRRP